MTEVADRELSVKKFGRLCPANPPAARILAQFVEIQIRILQKENVV